MTDFIYPVQGAYNNIIRHIWQFRTWKDRGM